MSKLIGFSHLLDEMEEYKRLQNSIKDGIMPINITGVSEAAAAHLVFCVQKNFNKQCIVIAPDGLTAKSIRQNLDEFCDSTKLFPEKELMFYDIDASFKEITSDRISALHELTQNPEAVIVTTIQAVLQPTLSAEKFKDGTIEFAVGRVFDTDALVSKLVSIGYVREQNVEGRGQFAMRGGILDFYSQDGDNAIRVEFFDDEVDSVRIFDVASQRSSDRVDKAVITPAAETDLSAEVRLKILDVIKDAKERTDYVKRDEERLIAGERFLSADKYIPTIFSEYMPTIIDYAEDAFVFLIEPKRIKESAETGQSMLDTSVKDAIDRGIIVPQKGSYRYDYHDMMHRLSKDKLIGLSGLAHSSPDYRPKEIINIMSKDQTPFHGNPELFYECINFYRQNKYRVIILAGTEQKARTISKNLADKNIISAYKQTVDTIPEMGEIYVTSGEISRGVEYPHIKTAIISDKEIFGSGRTRSRSAGKTGRQRIMSYSDLSVGDFVVHQNHGIGKFTGIKQMTVDGASSDYLQIVYSGGDTLYIPTNQLDMVYKYIGKETEKLKLNKLGGADWNNTKQRVKKACQDMAEQLISLYAKRQEATGISFSEDTEWQREFEAGFPYEETEDQLRCIDEVKQDMEKPMPMDRLLCGDVGYGKTEIALRAAFKAVSEGYQVAYLVPTTILANQHYNTFFKRMENYPVRVEMLSSFRTASQQKKIVKDLKSGAIDVIIGTHRILSKDIEFKKLGLLIIDEEQRFGVAHKERIKEVKASIDVLTLTATPIPRTLHMSLVGVRDMSVIEQPPRDRYPVATYVLEYDFLVIRDAILKELSRGGQVYYLHNRVRSIYKTAAMIQSISPDIRVAAAYGTMNEHELEEIMLQVINHEIDVLVCTTIIETGLDIANINTIIIEEADKMGLSQLYQLRGRVGRSNKMAYAYLTYQRDKVLNENASKRLKAIKEFTEFGSGFKLALRDLEIRGAGNLIGAQQHGHMDAVGYDMFCRLLAEAVAEEKGEEKALPQTSVSISIAVDAYIPSDYIVGENYRIEIYKRIAAISSQEDAFDVIDEIQDRYGDLPKSVVNLVDIAIIQAYATDLKMTEIAAHGKSLVLMFDETQKLNLKAISMLINEMKSELMFSPSAKPYLTYRNFNKNKLSNVKNMLLRLKTLNLE